MVFAGTTILSAFSDLSMLGGGVVGPETNGASLFSLDDLGPLPFTHFEHLFAFSARMSAVAEDTKNALLLLLPFGSSGRRRFRCALPALVARSALASCLGFPLG